MRKCQRRRSSRLHSETINTSANELNNDLKKVSDWACQWKMSFNFDPSKQAQEVIFSRKLKKVTHPPLVFTNANVSQCKSQTGTIRGTSKEKLYHELGLESLQLRSWYRKLSFL